MALRVFQDPAGEEWKVWEVRPYAARPGTERRAAERRQAPPGAYAGPERRCGRERRLRSPGLLTPGLEAGWLCFENPGEKRRLTPIPAAWQTATEEVLRALLGQARPVPRRMAPAEPQLTL